MKIIVKGLGVSLVACVLFASCSDEDKNYSEEIYFTATQESVVAIDRTGSTPSIGFPSTMVCFDAPSNWQISAKDATDRSQIAGWVSFLQTSGKEGSQRVGVYATDNTGQDRAAFVEIVSAEKTIEFLLVQSGSATVNPNEQLINPKKVVNRIEYFFSGNPNAYQTIAFAYKEGGITETLTIVENGVTKTYPFSISYNNEVKLSVLETNESYAILNNRVYIGYKTLTMNHVGKPNLINFEYDNEYLKRISTTPPTLFSWLNGNISEIDWWDLDFRMSYGDKINDANLDLNWFITEANCGVTSNSFALQFHLA